MKIEQIKAAVTAAPFVPFTLHWADGHNAEVPGPDWVSLHPTVPRVMIVHTREGGSRYLDTALITEITFQTTSQES